MSDSVLIEVGKEVVRKRFVEVVKRDKKGRIQQIIKVAVESLSNDAQNDGLIGAVKGLYSVLNNADGKLENINKGIIGIGKGIAGIDENVKGIAAGINSLSSLGRKVMKCQWIQLGLEALELAFTYAGFCQMNNKVKELDKKIDEMKATLHHVAQKGDMDLQKEYKDVRSEYMNMLDLEKRNLEFGETEQFELTKKMAGIIEYLYECFMADAANNPEILLDAIYSLLPMFTNILCKYDRTYYFKYAQKGDESSKTHMLQKEWESVISNLRSKQFLSKLEEYCFLMKGMHTTESTEAVNMTYMMALAAEVAIEDNKKIVECVNSDNEYQQYSIELQNEAVQDVLKAAEELDDEQIKLINPVLNRIQQQVTLMA